MDISEQIGNKILNPNPEPPSDTRYVEDQIFGPYYLIPSYANLAECTGERRLSRLHIRRQVVLYADVPALMATDGVKMIVSPLGTFDKQNGDFIEPPSIDPDALGYADFSLPVALFEQLPEEIPDGQTHLSLEIAFDRHDKCWYAYVQEQPLPRTPKRYRLEGGWRPNPDRMGFPQTPGVRQVLQIAAAHPTAQIGVDTEALDGLTRAMGCEAVTLHVHGRTGMVRVVDRDLDHEDLYSSRSIGLLMPLVNKGDLAFDDTHAVHRRREDDDEHWCGDSAC